MCRSFGVFFSVARGFIGVFDFVGGVREPDRRVICSALVHPSDPLGGRLFLYIVCDIFGFVAPRTKVAFECLDFGNRRMC